MDNSEKKPGLSAMGRGVALYHRVFKHEDFEKAAQDIFSLTRDAHEKWPGKPRYLYLDIEGHRNTAGGFDAEMLELQREFLLGFLGQHFMRMCIPLGEFERKEQSDDLPDVLNIQKTK